MSSVSITAPSNAPPAAAEKCSLVAAIMKHQDEEEFEEFPIQEWHKLSDDEDKEVNMWEDSWDDETHGSEFSKQLKEELRNGGN